MPCPECGEPSTASAGLLQRAFQPSGALLSWPPSEHPSSIHLMSHEKKKRAPEIPSDTGCLLPSSYFIPCLYSKDFVQRADTSNPSQRKANSAPVKPQAVLPNGRAGLQFTNTWCGRQLRFYKSCRRYLWTS